MKKFYGNMERKLKKPKIIDEIPPEMKIIRRKTTGGLFIIASKNNKNNLKKKGIFKAI